VLVLDEKNEQRKRYKMKIKAAFIFVAEKADSKQHRAVIDTQGLTLYVVGVENYEQAVQVAKELVAEGIKAIELCAGFGNEGTSLISKAVGSEAVVGAVRFDRHPAFGYKSGDEMFQ